MRQWLVCWLGAVMLSLSAVHAEEPAQSPVTPEEMQRELATFASPLEYAKSLKAEAEKGDGRAKYKFAMALMVLSPDPSRSDAAEREQWREVGSRYQLIKWITVSAEAGYRPAMEHLCSIGQDKLAPADLREMGQEWCTKLGQ